jgi:hypothetical protein
MSSINLKKDDDEVEIKSGASTPVVVKKDSFVEEKKKKNFQIVLMGCDGFEKYKDFLINIIVGKEVKKTKALDSNENWNEKFTFDIKDNMKTENEFLTIEVLKVIIKNYK